MLCLCLLEKENCIDADWLMADPVQFDSGLHPFPTPQTQGKFNGWSPDHIEAVKFMGR